VTGVYPDVVTEHKDLRCYRLDDLFKVCKCAGFPRTVGEDGVAREQNSVSVKGKLRGELLNRDIFTMLTEARVLIER